MLKEYDSLKKKTFQVMDENGTVTNQKYFKKLDTDLLNEGLKRILRARTIDEMAVSYQRQGRMYTFPPNLGQEAIAVAAGLVMRKEDWLVPAYRELGAWLAKGMTIQEFFLYWGGHEDGVALKNADNMMPISVPIASQLLHGTGIAYGLKYKKQKGVVFAFCGDGGTSEGDFHEALNFAGVWNVPVVFVIQNNGYAISCPTSKQTKSDSIAIKSVAYGIKGIQIDGNDLSACYLAMKEAAEHAESGKGPVLIEALTYRVGAHTTSDDPTRYRTEEEENQWKPKDPVERLKTYLKQEGRWNDEEEKTLIAQYKKEVDEEFKKVENYTPYALEDCFRFMYSDMPDELKRQKNSYEKFLRASGGQA